MKKLLFTLAIMLSMCTTTYAAGDEDKKTKPKTLCEMVQQLTTGFDRLEASVNTRLDQMDQRIGDIELTVATVKQDVDQLKATVGNFGGTQPEYRKPSPSNDVKKTKKFFIKNIRADGSIREVTRIDEGNLKGPSPEWVHLLDPPPYQSAWYNRFNEIMPVEEVGEAYRPYRIKYYPGNSNNWHTVSNEFWESALISNKGETELVKFNYHTIFRTESSEEGLLFEAGKPYKVSKILAQNQKRWKY